MDAAVYAATTNATVVIFIKNRGLTLSLGKTGLQEYAAQTMGNGTHVTTFNKKSHKRGKKIDLQNSIRGIRLDGRDQTTSQYG
jgi:hypothetical protein